MKVKWVEYHLSFEYYFWNPGDMTTLDKTNVNVVFCNSCARVPFQRGYAWHCSICAFDVCLRCIPVNTSNFPLDAIVCWLDYSHKNGRTNIVAEVYDHNLEEVIETDLKSFSGNPQFKITYLHEYVDYLSTFEPAPWKSQIAFINGCYIMVNNNWSQLLEPQETPEYAEAKRQRTL